MLASSGLYAQYKGAKNGIAARFIQSNFQFPLSNDFQRDDFYGGGEIEYTRYINSFLNFSIPFKYAQPLLPLDGFGKQLEGNILQGDALLHFKYFREKGFIFPSVFLGIGASLENWEAYNYFAPAGIAINFRFRKHAYLTVRGEYRYSLEHDFRNHLVLSAGVNVLLGKGIPPNPDLVDTDKDGVPDVEDDCPLVAGLYEVRGCPDKDSDGVPDEEDSCPNTPGLFQFRGCPDMDGDGLQDRYDQCPNERGPLENDGCPITDRDGDGIDDVEDPCPHQAGTTNGCPDTDKDGVIDANDQCPNMKGSKATKGCPDQDKDGVSDLEDHCPDSKGTVDEKGCPIIKNEDLDILKQAASKIRFKEGLSELLNESINILDQVVEILVRNPDYHLSIDGHTDSIGSRHDNMKLSEKRAKQCYDYLVKHGINAGRLKFQGFGESKPIADNRYKAGRQKNRRIEFAIFFNQ